LTQIHCLILWFCLIFTCSQFPFLTTCHQVSELTLQAHPQSAFYVHVDTSLHFSFLLINQFNHLIYFWVDVNACSQFLYHIFVEFLWFFTCFKHGCFVVLIGVVFITDWEIKVHFLWKTRLKILVIEWLWW